MRRRSIGIVAVSVALLISIYFLVRERSPFGGGNTAFATGPENEITRIEISNDTGTVTLEKDADRWLVNGKNEARKNSILFIIRILTGMEIKSPVTPELYNDEITSKAIEPVKVRVFGERRRLRSFLVYRTSSNRYGNIMKMTQNSKPFIVYVPGNEVEIGSAFIINELYWQPFTLFELLPSEISSVRVENIKEPGSSFQIRHTGSEYNLSDLKNNLTGWDTSRVVRYITYFTHIAFESWATDLSPEEKERIMTGPLIYRLTVEKTDGQTTILDLRERKVERDGTEITDSDRLWGKTETTDEIFVIRYLDIDPVLKKSSYFFPE